MIRHLKPAMVTICPLGRAVAKVRIDDLVTVYLRIISHKFCIGFTNLA